MKNTAWKLRYAPHIGFGGVAKPLFLESVGSADPVAAGEARPRLYEACVARWNGDGEACPDKRSLPRSERDGLAGREVEAGVSLVRALRQDSVGS